MPPEAPDVPRLMKELVDLINQQVATRALPVPLIAALVHYQFATIHPYYDGNGRTARLLTNQVLHQSGYGLHGIYSLEEYYARNLAAYYAALDIGDSHNYSMGRGNADLTPWVGYFCAGMAESFSQVRAKLSEQSGGPDGSALLRELDQRQKRVIALFRESRFITTREISEELGVHRRTALNWCQAWVADGFLIQQGDAQKSRRYELTEKWLSLID
ncbi:MAG: Fic family protein [Verrucomicrobia bacterium]|nr:Fic family protein [Verrucomicrobiota bacterium]